MAKATSTQGCLRQVQLKEIARRYAGFDPVRNILLTLVQFFAESFAAHHFGADEGAVIAQRLLFAVQAMEETRQSEFNFSSPSCKVCSEIVTGNERRFMAAITNVRRVKLSTSVTELIFLSKGNHTSRLINRINNLCAVLPSISSTYSTKQMEA
jgi:hypothetical protein